MSEAIIARAGGGKVDLSGVNSSLSSINSKITSINSKISSINSNINSIWDKLNNSGGGSSGGGTGGGDIPIYGDKCSILVTAKDSSGALFEGITVSCKDGSAWYNYTTNSRGQALFVTNSGSANFTAWNANVEGNYKYIDQAPVVQNVDAPRGTTKNITMQLSRITTKEYTGNMNNNIFNNTAMFGGNHRVRVSSYANIFLGGAGSGGRGTWWSDGGSAKGGYGGGITIVNNIKINKNQNYLFAVYNGGKGGVGGQAPDDYVGEIGPRSPGSGGTTSAFGYTATGGSLSTWGTGNYNGGSSSKSSAWANWGGDGGSGRERGGSPHGGHGGNYSGGYNSGMDGDNGGGGGGGYGTSGRWGADGGNGGPGKINFTFR